MTFPGSIDKRLQTIDDRIAQEQKISKHTRQLNAQYYNSSFSIEDRQTFNKWYDTYSQTPKFAPQLELDQEKLWQKYQKTILNNRYIVAKPQIVENGNSPQMEFLLTDSREVLYGGACGGGKTTALLMSALQYVEEAEYAGLLLRKTITDLCLPGGLMNLARCWLRGKAKFDKPTNTFTFPSGAQLVFGYCENNDDAKRYQSSQFQFIGIDELTQWNEDPYLFLFSRLRRNFGSSIPLRIRSASNPGGVGHQWVKDRFIKSQEADREYIPAKLADNPGLDRKTYSEILMNLSPVIREQLLNGNWEINAAGRIFQAGWFLEEETYPEGERLVRYWDKAGTELKKGRDSDYTVGVKATKADGIFHVIDVQRFRGTPLDNERKIRAVAEEDGTRVTIYMEQEPASAGVSDIDNYARNILSGYSFYGVTNRESKELRASPLSAYAEKRYVRILKAPWNKAFLEEFELFPEGPHDDIVDATVGAFSKLNDRRPLIGATVVRAFGHGSLSNGPSFW